MLRWFSSTEDVPLMRKVTIEKTAYTAQVVLFLKTGLAITKGQAIPISSVERHEYGDSMATMIPVAIKGEPDLYIFAPPGTSSMADIKQ